MKTKRLITNGKFKMLQIGRQYYPLKDAGKKFSVADTIDYQIKFPDKFFKLFKTKITKNEMFDTLIKFEMLYDYIEQEVYKKIMKDDYIKDVTWCRISHVSESLYKGQLTISIDLLEEI